MRGSALDGGASAVLCGLAEVGSARALRAFAGVGTACALAAVDSAKLASRAWTAAGLRTTTAATIEAAIAVSPAHRSRVVLAPSRAGSGASRLSGFSTIDG